MKGVGPAVGKLLNHCGIETVEDFLFYFPRIYDDRRNLPPISHLEPNAVQTCVGTINYLSESQTKGHVAMIKCLISDATGSLVAIWFNQPFMKKVLKIGQKILVKGKVEHNAYTNEVQMGVTETEVHLHIGEIVPCYPLIEGLHQYKMRQIARTVLDDYLQGLTDPCPNPKLMNLKDAVKNLHFPKDSESYTHARHRVVFDEFFYFQLALARKQTHYQKKLGFKLKTDGEKVSAYLKNLPYTLTQAQMRVIQEIGKDVALDHCMNRLLQGDVGCGKTDVAVMAILFAIESGKKAAIMAPTEILAEQHFYKFSKYLSPLNIPIVLLTGKIKSKERKKALEILKNGTPCVAIGTHALIQDPVEIPGLGLAVIDEQHRFGVMQRILLSQKSENPHALFMTATPIPRSLMLTCFGDLDKSIIDEMPPGRKPAKTSCVKEADLPKVYNFCRTLLQRGEQIYIVYPLVEESETLDLKSATEGWEELQKTVFADYRVGLIHGRLSPAQKAEVMDNFKAGKLQVLVATTVIEVGIDVPNASMMVIHHAERFGLSQLHQLRGRIGRGASDSYCFLIAKPKTDGAKKRLKAMVDTHDGFKIAEYDLSIRGPGDMLGTKQAGLPEFKLADLIKDEKILLAAREAAFDLVRRNPDLSENKLIRERLEQHETLLLKTKLN